MTVTIVAPENYGYVILTCIVGQFIASQYMSNQVMMARKKFKVEYPNAYATPGYHKEADAFNRVQRGHMNYFETLTTFSLLALIGGLKHPLTCAASGVLYNLGSILYQIGYADVNLDVKMARYKRGGPIKFIGLFAALGSTISFAGSICGWW